MNLNLTLPPTTGGGWIALGILAFAALSLLIGLLFGLRRGFTKTVIRLVTVAIAAVISYCVAVGISGSLDGLFAGKTLEEVILSVWSDYETAVKPETREIIAAFDAETAQLILGLVISLLVSPVVFVVAFYAVKAVLWVVFWILSAILKKTNRHKGFLSTLFGGAVGVVQGALIAACVLIPITGFFSLAGDVKADLLSRDDISAESKEEIETFYASWLDEPISSPLVSVIGDNGGDKVFAALTRATVDGEEYDMREKAALVANVVVDVSELEGMNWQTPTEEQQEAIEHITERMGEDEYTARLLAGVLRGSSTALTENVEVFGLEAPYDDLFVEAFSIFLDSDESNVGTDLDTMTEIYFLMADNDVLVLIGENDHEGLKAKLAEKNGDELFIDTIIDTLQENPRTEGLVALFTKLSVSIMCDRLGLGEDIAIIYEGVKSDFNDVLSLSEDDFETPEEYRAAVNESVATALEENGILLEDDIVSGMADYIADNYSDKEEITDEDINDAILSYYSSYVSFTEGGELPEETPEA